MASKSDTSPSSSEESKKLMPRSRAAIDLRRFSNEDLNNLMSSYKTSAEISTPNSSKKSSIRRAVSAAERYKGLKPSIPESRSRDTSDIENDKSTTSPINPHHKDYRSKFNTNKQLFLQLEANAPGNSPSENPTPIMNSPKFRPIDFGTKIPPQKVNPYRIRSPNKRSGIHSVPTSSCSSPTNENVPLNSTNIGRSTENLSYSSSFEHNGFSSFKKPLLKKQSSMDSGYSHTENRNIHHQSLVPQKPQNHKRSVKITTRKVVKTTENPKSKEVSQKAPIPIEDTRSVNMQSSTDHASTSSVESYSKFNRIKPSEGEEKSKGSKPMYKANPDSDCIDKESSLGRKGSRIAIRNTAKISSDQDVDIDDENTLKSNNSESNSMKSLQPKRSKPPRSLHTPPSQRRLQEFKNHSQNRSTYGLTNIKSPTDRKIDKLVPAKYSNPDDTLIKDDSDFSIKEQAEDYSASSNEFQGKPALDEKFSKSMEMMNIAKAASIQQFRNASDSDSEIFEENKGDKILPWQDINYKENIDTQSGKKPKFGSLKRLQGDSEVFEENKGDKILPWQDINYKENIDTQSGKKPKFGSLKRLQRDNPKQNETNSDGQPAIVVSESAASKAKESDNVDIASEDEIDMFEYQFSLNQPSVFSDSEGYDIQAVDRQRINSSSEAIDAFIEQYKSPGDTSSKQSPTESREKSDRIDNIEQQLKSLTLMLTQKNQETVREFQAKETELNTEMNQFKDKIQVIATNILKDVTKLREEYTSLRQQQEIQQQLFDITLANTIKSIRTATSVMTRGQDIVRDERLAADKTKLNYQKQSNQLTKEVELLSRAIAVLEYDARKRFCRIDSSVIKALKLAIIEINSSITSLAQEEFPKIKSELKEVLIKEQKLVVMDEKFILSEPERLESALDQCRRLMSYMNSLVASVKLNAKKQRSGNRASNIADYINLLALQRQAQDDYEANEAKSVLQANIEIASAFNHEKRLSSIERAMEVRAFINELRIRYENKHDDDDGLSGVSSNESDSYQHESHNEDITNSVIDSSLATEPTIHDSNLSISKLENLSTVDSIPSTTSIYGRDIGASFTTTPPPPVWQEVDENVETNQDKNTTTESGKKRGAIFNKLTGFLYRGKNESPQPKSRPSSIISTNESENGDIQSSQTMSKSPSAQRRLDAYKTEPVESPGTNPLKHYQGQGSLTSDQIIQELSLRHNIDIASMQNKDKNTTNFVNYSDNLTSSGFQPKRQSSEIPSTFHNENLTDTSLSKSALTVSASELPPANINLATKKDRSSLSLPLSKANDINAIRRDQFLSAADSNPNEAKSNGKYDSVLAANGSNAVSKKDVLASKSVNASPTDSQNIIASSNPNKTNLLDSKDSIMLSKPTLSISSSKSMDLNLINPHNEIDGKEITAAEAKRRKSHTVVTYDSDQVSFL
ncbi:uncharacterized protein TRIADDRAFT_54841 [Trichoplax adhaerens]|uniref:Uncharacterized protein n=1 Tax=Trichoplax adhaerens TaxID=10228 RepID=B3RT52_TRIAD|nr:hypothetical protein TRIADDRAFT_54841 [Trichoplax adhaerens]EDV27163.1 hypothetical protein TRIADDRAFT_54841 [Trichoplax adhaerens]|eukprot:XP_002111159.1 hypothetical protein TRIADDRAFT_54841 [Trichoplax adhaerens]